MHGSRSRPEGRRRRLNVGREPARRRAGVLLIITSVLWLHQWLPALSVLALLRSSSSESVPMPMSDADRVAGNEEAREGPPERRCEKPYFI